VRANLRAAEGDLVGALGDYDRAIAIKPWLLAALSGKGAVLMQLGRLDEAIAVNEKVLRLKANDTIGLRNLALLYREKGDTANALDFARRARAVAPSSERAGLDTFIAEVESGTRSSLPR
jgi:tetratricopeptide (TPR) repeat protein